MDFKEVCMANPPETAKNVPNEKVAALKAIWESEGFAVTVNDNGDGTSDVTASWPTNKG
jgi:hypothetical protein